MSPVDSGSSPKSVTAEDNAAHDAAARSFDPGDWRSVRAQFLLSPDLAHLSNFYFASNPTPVRDAITRYRNAFDENPYNSLDDNMFARDEDMLWRRVCAAAAEYLGGQPDEVALTSSTTMGLALVYHGLVLKPGQEVLTTTHEFYPHYEAMRLACEKWGATMREIPLYESSRDFSVDEAVARIRAALRPNTRVFSIAWVHSGTGVRVPIATIAQVIAEVNRDRDEADRVLFVVDGVHGFGVVDEDVAAMGCDFFSAGTHKWILGPRGTGILWAKRESWALLRPTIPSLMTREPADAWRQNRPPAGPTTGPWVSPGGFFAYEHQWAVAEAFDFVEQIGRRRIQDRIAEMNGLIKEGLADMEHVTLHTPLDPGLSAGIVCFDVRGYEPMDVVRIFRDNGVVASATPYAVSHVRLSAGIVNFPEDVHRALDVVRSLA
ncbi:aminotransferase class V-fold PLP-dependent enzyme [Saccharothrix longispora]|uniref:aminotransferase class V-fold PLP-dependent enzyme n=1 Tax=Saccharothrix longispora TaxID=33920 RepID=UPI0028FDB4F8|nr:aminotransferase class V-fold PLP-dependent enzyme [Saccharothrix longispora]MDU0290390.1 aminotransferase class V-fold PLP-dependent enzyme [Saccharothrix longispora]